MHNVVEPSALRRCRNHRLHEGTLRATRSNRLLCLGEGLCRIGEAVEFTTLLLSISKTIRDNTAILDRPTTLSSATTTSDIEPNNLQQLRDILRRLQRSTPSDNVNDTFAAFSDENAWSHRVIATMQLASAVVDQPRGPVDESTCSACASSSDPQMVFVSDLCVLLHKLTFFKKIDVILWNFIGL